MLKGGLVLGQMAALLVSTALFACTQEAAENEETVSSESEAIIGGSPATSAKFGAVGALVFYIPEFGVADVFCSATLVGPKAVVTARHCTPQIQAAFDGGFVPAVAFGPDAFNPTQVVPITDYVNAPNTPGNGLLMDGGRDVAVAHLASKPTGVVPAKLGAFSECDVGKKFEIAGYGVYNSDHFYGAKHAGKATARALKGKWYPLLFNNNYKAYLNWYFTDSSDTTPTQAEADDWWKSFKLETNYELLAGGLKNEAVACNVDSGGPLLSGSTANNLTVHGVAFAVENTRSTACGLGGGYLVFNDKMLKFVKGAI